MKSKQWCNLYDSDSHLPHFMTTKFFVCLFQYSLLPSNWFSWTTDELTVCYVFSVKGHKAAVFMPPSGDAFKIFFWLSFLSFRQDFHIFIKTCVFLQWQSYKVFLTRWGKTQHNERWKQCCYGKHIINL